MFRRLVLTAAVTSMSLLTVSGAASAHIDPDPARAQAGSRLTVGFTVEHGCSGSPTVQLDMRLPQGVTDAVTEPLDGWDGSVDAVDGDTIVTFTGGPLPDDVEGTFSVTMTLPRAPDTTIFFPFVQRCEVDEIRWIGIPARPGDELDEPAPAMELTGPVAPAPTTVPVTEPIETAPVTTDRTTTPTTEQPPQTGPAPGSSEPAVIASADEDPSDSDTGTTGTVVFIASIAAVLGIGGFVVLRSRQARAGSGHDAT
jgi:periplasmic copper chaperone A